jgi:hypothetical protein
MVLISTESQQKICTFVSVNSTEGTFERTLSWLDFDSCKLARNTESHLGQILSSLQIPLREM